MIQPRMVLNRTSKKTHEYTFPSYLQSSSSSSSSNIMGINYEYYGGIPPVVDIAHP